MWCYALEKCCEEMRIEVFPLMQKHFCTAAWVRSCKEKRREAWVTAITGYGYSTQRTNHSAFWEKRCSHFSQLWKQKKTNMCTAKGSNQPGLSTNKSSNELVGVTRKIVSEEEKSIAEVSTVRPRGPDFCWFPQAAQAAWSVKPGSGLCARISLHHK